MKKLKFYTTTTSIILLLFLNGCSENNYKVTQKINNTNSIHAAKAEEFLNLAANEKSKNNKIRYKLNAAEQLLKINSVFAAEQTLYSIKPNEIDYDLGAYHNILMARIALTRQQVKTAENKLNNIWQPSKLPQDLYIKFLQTSAKLKSLTNKHLESIKDRLTLADLDIDNKENIQQEIWEILNELTPSTLHTLRYFANDNISLSGWISMAYLNKQYDSNSQEMQTAILSWQDTYKDHPAHKLIPNSILLKNNDEEIIEQTTRNNEYKFNNQKPKKIALFLPLTGTYKKPANAILNGFLSSYYNNKSAKKPKLKVYDTTSNNIASLYKQAISDNTDFIIGPLLKEDIEQLNNISYINIPILTLNTLPSNSYNSHKNIFQFGLEPEQEAKSIAEYAWQNGKQNALVIIPENEWGKRSLESFKANFNSLGGRVIDSITVSDNKDLSKAIKNILAINESESRASRLKNLKMKFNFEARRRQDIDMIFIAANSNLTKQIKPLLNFYYANDIKTFATSTIYAETTDQTSNQDLNNIVFCDMPWMLDPSIRSKTIYKSINSTWPGSFKNNARLYALGVDAYKISQQLHQLMLFPEFGISGMTGLLTLAEEQKINRKFIWGYFNNGTAKLLNNSYDEDNV